MKAQETGAPAAKRSRNHPGKVVLWLNLGAPDAHGRYIPNMKINSARLC